MTEQYPGPRNPEYGDQYGRPPAYPPVPPTGYTVMPADPQPLPYGYYGQQPYSDPLISPDYAGWWQRGVAIAKRAWKPLAALQAAGLLLSLLTLVPLSVYATIVTEDLSQTLPRTSSEATPDLTPLFGLFGLAAVSIALTVLVSSIVTLASVHIGVSAAVGVEPSVAEALRLGAQRVFPLIGWSLLAAPIYLLGLCLCVLPVFYVAAIFVVLPAVVAVERTNAVSRCFSLFHNDFGAAAGRAATILGISLGVGIVGGLVGSALEAIARTTTPGTGGVILGSAVSSLLSAVIAAGVAILLAPLTLTAYADLRARREPTSGLHIAQQLGVVAAHP